MLKSIEVTEMDNPTEITDFDVGEVTRTLLSNDAYTIMDNIEGENRFGTAPIYDSYFAMCSSHLTSDLEATAQFIQKNQYPNQKKTLRNQRKN